MERTPIEALETVGKEMSGVMEGFFQLHDSATADGALSAKQKRLTMVAVSLVQRCRPCLETHLKAAVELGATRREIMEILGVATLMGGGSVAGPGSIAVLEILEEIGI
jgi:AhpD family alkylhydroperoxidase